METRKFGCMEISEHHYRSVTVTFGSFPGTQVFFDCTTKSVLGRIRAVAFIAHMLPRNPKACQRFANGHIIFTVATRPSEAIKPLEQLAVSNITVSTPNMVYSTTGDIGLSLMSRLSDDRKPTLRRPDLSARQAQMSCRESFASVMRAADRPRLPIANSSIVRLPLRNEGELSGYGFNGHNMISISRSLFRDSPHFHGPPGTRQR
ncbi:hypothetical protein DL763_010284 [Monosporascus cannonballus]|nr:hypothetical protein DL763_010284 [Monosporascus cannonballus]